MAIAKITKAYIRYYTDSGQTTAYVEWKDYKGKQGRSEGSRFSTHMVELMKRAEREGITVERQTW